jgi:hypothetical protein
VAEIAAFLKEFPPSGSSLQTFPILGWPFDTISGVMELLEVDV